MMTASDFPVYTRWDGAKIVVSEIEKTEVWWQIHYHFVPSYVDQKYVVRWARCDYQNEEGVLEAWRLLVGARYGAKHVLNWRKT